MSVVSYFLGIIFAIIAGFIVNIGVLIQKYVINKHSDDPNFMLSLAKSPLWIFGILLQIVIGGLVFYMLAIIFIGPALVPGLMSAGLIILALGSIRLLNETLGKEEIIGILLMIAGITFLGLSELAIDVSTFNILDSGFILRIIIFTISIILIALVFDILRRKNEKHKGLLMAVEAGFILSLNTVWASLGTTVLTHVIDGIIIDEELIFAIFIGIILIIIMVVGITLGQISLKYGQANILVPLTSVPMQIVPVLAFFTVFLSVPSSVFSLLFLILGFILVISSSFLLSKRQAMLSEIKSE